MKTDQISKPARGKIFAASYVELLGLIKEQAFNVHSYHERLPLFLQNCDFECPNGLQLASFNRNGYLAVFSLPEDTNVQVARKAIESAIVEFGAIDKGPRLTTKDEQIVIYRAYLKILGQLTITRDIMNAGHRSYLVYKKIAQISKTQKVASNEITLLQKDLCQPLA
jgi:hypothetical protein